MPAIRLLNFIEDPLVDMRIYGTASHFCGMPTLNMFSLPCKSTISRSRGATARLNIVQCLGLPHMSSSNSYLKHEGAERSEDSFLFLLGKPFCQPPFATAKPPAEQFNISPVVIEFLHKTNLGKK